MFELPENLTLKDCRTGQRCDAIIVRLTKDLAKQIDVRWWQIGISKEKRKREPDNGWKWADFAGESRMNQWSECLGIRIADGSVQGAINYRLDGKSLVNNDLGTVFVHHLATATWNRPWLVESPQYRGAGTALLVTAVLHSYSLGLRGRVVVPSLPTEHTRSFYENFGFQQIGEDEGGIIDYELTSDAAQQWLREEGYLK